MASETGQDSSQAVWVRTTPHEGYSKKKKKMSPKEEAQNLETAFGLSGQGISEGGKLRQRAATSKEVASEKLP